MSELAKKYRIKIAFHIHHGTIIPSASAAFRFISNFSPEYMGVIYDPGNMVFEGYENFRLGLDLLGKYIFHVHVKNAVLCPSADSHNNLTLSPVWSQTAKA